MFYHYAELFIAELKEVLTDETITILLVDYIVCLQLY